MNKLMLAAGFVVLLAPGCVGIDPYPNQGNCVYGWFDWKRTGEPSVEWVWIVKPKDEILTKICKDTAGKSWYGMEALGCTWHTALMSTTYSYYSQQEAKSVFGASCGESLYDHELKHRMGLVHQ